MYRLPRLIWPPYATTRNLVSTITFSVSDSIFFFLHYLLIVNVNKHLMTAHTKEGERTCFRSDAIFDKSMFIAYLYAFYKHLSLQVTTNKGRNNSAILNRWCFYCNQCIIITLIRSICYLL
jgi:hypothetical protein